MGHGVRTRLDEYLRDAFDGQVFRGMHQVRGIWLVTGVAQKDLARKSGYAVRTVEEALSARRRPHVDTTIDLLEALGFELVLRRKP